MIYTKRYWFLVLALAEQAGWAKQAATLQKIGAWPRVEDSPPPCLKCGEEVPCIPCERE